jgi:hypothetical protein
MTMPIVDAAAGVAASQRQHNEGFDARRVAAAPRRLTPVPFFVSADAHVATRHAVAVFVTICRCPLIRPYAAQRKIREPASTHSAPFATDAYARAAFRLAFFHTGFLSFHCRLFHFRFTLTLLFRYLHYAITPFISCHFDSPPCRCCARCFFFVIISLRHFPLLIISFRHFHYFHF